MTGVAVDCSAINIGHLLAKREWASGYKVAKDLNWGRGVFPLGSKGGSSPGNILGESVESLEGISIGSVARTDWKFLRTSHHKT